MAFKVVPCSVQLKSVHKPAAGFLVCLIVTKFDVCLPESHDASQKPHFNFNLNVDVLLHASNFVCSSLSSLGVQMCKLHLPASSSDVPLIPICTALSQAYLFERPKMLTRWLLHVRHHS